MSFQRMAKRPPMTTSTRVIMKTSSSKFSVIYTVHMIHKDDIVIMGRTGILFGGPKVMNNTTMICVYVSLLTREVFIGSFFVRTFVLDDSLKIIRSLIMTYQKVQIIYKKFATV